MTEAKCPKCGEWSEVVDETPGWIFYSWAWKESSCNNCQWCGEVVLFESECEFREVSDYR